MSASTSLPRKVRHAVMSSAVFGDRPAIGGSFFANVSCTASSKTRAAVSSFISNSLGSVVCTSTMREARHLRQWWGGGATRIGLPA